MIQPPMRTCNSGIYIALLLSQAILCSLGAKILARLQIVYLALNIMYKLHFNQSN